MLIKTFVLFGLLLILNLKTYGQNPDSIKILTLLKQFDHSYNNQQYEQCRDYAEEIIQIDDSNCNAFMLLGITYASIPKEYLSTITKEEIENQVIYCLAVDMFQKASTVDTLCTSEANKKIAIYSKYFPSIEEPWIEDYNDIDYYFGGWINRTTKVRFKKFVKDE